MLAEDLHVHPAIVAGVPESITAHFWFVWAGQRRSAETGAQQQLQRSAQRRAKKGKS